MKKSFRTFAVALSILLLPSWLGAQATSIPPESPSLYKGVRPTGMGNAFVAMPGSDENAMFYNPAAINDYEGAHFRVFSPLVDFSPGSIGLVQDVFDLADDIDAAGNDADKIDVFQTFVDAHTGQFESVQFRMPLLTMMNKWVSFSLLADSRNTFSFRNRTFTNVEIFSRSDMGGIIGTSYNFKDLLGIQQNVQAGVNVKVIHRLTVDEIITTDDIINNADFNDVVPRNRATGVGVDFGLKGEIPTFENAWLELLKPTVGFTWQDIGDTRFGNGVVDTAQSISVGLGIHPTWGKWQFHVDNDFRELNQNSDFIKKWNIGAEVMAPRMLGFFQPSIRVGANQGYIAAGASFDMRFFKVEASTYGEEAGQFTRQKELRRVAANLSFGF